MEVRRYQCSYGHAPSATAPTQTGPAHTVSTSEIIFLRLLLSSDPPQPVSSHWLWPAWTVCLRLLCLGSVTNTEHGHTCLLVWTGYLVSSGQPLHLPTRSDPSPRPGVRCTVTVSTVHSRLRFRKKKQTFLGVFRQESPSFPC